MFIFMGTLIEVPVHYKIVLIEQEGYALLLRNSLSFWEICFLAELD